MTIMTERQQQLPTGSITVAQAKRLLEMEKTSELIIGEKWCLIDLMWWLEFVQRVDSAKNDDDLIKTPPVSNEAIVERVLGDSNDPVTYELKPNMQLGVNITVVPEKVFNELQKHIGLENADRDKIAREVVTGNLLNQKTYIEIYPLLIKIADYNNKDEVHTIPISSADSIEKIRNAIMDRLQINEDDRKNAQFLIEEKGQFEALPDTISQMKLSALINSGSTVYVDTSNNAQQSSNNGATRQGTRYAAYTRTNANPPGVCGIQNLGNTCFMNSALQCLSNVPELTHYFLSNEYSHEINENNPLGTSGALVRAYAELIREMWSGQVSSVRPQKLKSVIGEFAPRFNGYAQQDSQELTAFLLDGLHEDLNRIKKKPYIEEKEADGRNEALVAREAWADYKKRNDSIIVDLMHGQLKSTLTCNVCQKVSIKFDPFCFLSVPIPARERQMKSMVTFVRANKWAKFCITHTNKTTMRQLKQYVKDQLPYPPETEIVMLTYFGNDIVDDDQMLGMPYNYGTKQFYAFTVDGPGQVVLVENRTYTGVGYSQPLLGLMFPVNRPEKFTRRFIIEHVLPRCRDYFWHERAGTSSVEDNATKLKTEDKLNGNELVGDEQETAELLPAEILIVDSNSNNDTGIPFPEELDEEVDCSQIGGGVKIILKWKETKQFYTVNVDSLVEREGSMNIMPKKAYTLKECIEVYTTCEQLNEEDSWFCPRCKIHQQAFKKLDLWSLPQILIIHLKRFIYSRYTRDKIDTEIEIPVSGLDLSDKVLGPEHKNDVYDLIGIDNHYGGLGSGHYTARALNANVWCEFNDSSAYPMGQTLQDTLTSREAYMLVYRRRGSPEPQIRKSPRIAAAVNSSSSSSSTTATGTSSSSSPSFSGSTNFSIVIKTNIETRSSTSSSEKRRISESKMETD